MHDEMTENEHLAAAAVLREAGMYDAARHHEVAADTAHRAHYDHKWQVLWERDEIDLH